MTDEEKLRERRHEPRYEIAASHDVSVTLQRKSEGRDETIDGELLDLSRGGSKIRVPACLQFSEILDLRLSVADLELRIDAAAEVCWIRPADENNWLVGLTFSPKISAEVMERLAAAGVLERRSHPRERVSISAMARWELENETFSVQIRDFSAGGFCMRGPRSGKVGQGVLVFLPDPDDSSRPISGKVRWHMEQDDGYIVGCILNDESDCERLRRASEPQQRRRHQRTAKTSKFDRNVATLATLLIFTFAGSLLLGLRVWEIWQWAARDPDVRLETAVSPKHMSHAVRHVGNPDNSSTAAVDIPTNPSRNHEPLLTPPAAGSIPTDGADGAITPDEFAAHPAAIETPPASSGDAASGRPGDPDFDVSQAVDRTHEPDLAQSVSGSNATPTDRTNLPPDVPADVQVAEQQITSLVNIIRDPQIRSGLADTLSALHSSDATEGLPSSIVDEGNSPVTETPQPADTGAGGGDEPPAGSDGSSIASTEGTPETKTPRPGGPGGPEVDRTTGMDAPSANVNVRQAAIAFGDGARLYRDGRYGQATEVLRTAVAMNPTKALYHYVLAMSQYQMGEMGQAEGTLERAVALEQQRPIKKWGSLLSRYQGPPRLWVEQRRKSALAGTKQRLAP